VPDWREEQDTAYRAIGWYFEAFSLLVASMRDSIVVALTDGDFKRADLARLALGSQSAQQIADAFFAICRASVQLDEDEKAIEKRLRLQVDDEIRRRNRLAHGDWLVDIPSPNEPDDQVAVLERVKPSSREPFITEPLTVAEITDFGGSARQLDQVVSIFGMSCAETSQERVRTVLEIDGGQVINNQAYLRREARERGY
jgi:hypothetical protein